MKRQILLLALFSLVILIVSGCGSANGNSGGGGPVSVEVIPSAARLDEGTSWTFHATVLNDASNSAVTWSVTGDATLSQQTANSVLVTAGNTTGSFVLKASSVNDPADTSVADSSVDAPPAISNGSALPAGTTGQPYTGTVTATGGTAPLMWSVSSGSLPTGLTINSGTGAISGTPTAAGTFNFSIQVMDSANVPQSQTSAESITIHPGLSINAVIPPTAIIGSPYSLTISATGGTTPYNWAVSAGALPTGLSLNATSGSVSGTPSAAGNFSPTIQVADSSNPPVTATASLNMTASQPLAISSSALLDATVGTPYTGGINVTGGTSPLTFSISAGSLPAGVSLNAQTGALSGTPTTAVASSFTVHVADSSTPAQTPSKSFSLRANAALNISTSTLPSAALGAPYDGTIVVLGGVAPLTFTISSGSLPGGLSLNSTTGIITGTPTASGTFNFTVQVTDSANPPRSTSIPLSITVNSQFAVTSPAPLNGILGIPYAYVPTVSAGGVLPLAWTISTGALPAGLSVNSATGVIAGTPSAAGTSNFTLKVTDSSTPTPQVALFPAVITINNPLAIVLSTLPNGIIGVPFTATLTTTGAVPPLTWSITAGALPTGLTLNASTGVISGSPTASGTANFTVQVADSTNPVRTATQAMSIAVNSLLSITPITLPNAVLSVSLSPITFSATGGVAPLTWSISSGSLPAGLSLSAAGVITGIPTAAGLASFTVQVMDHSAPAQTATLAVSLQVNSLLSITTSVLPDAISGVPYVGALVSTGGVTPLTWSITSGALPAGLSLNATTGAITGLSTATGTSSFTAQVTDSSHPAQVKTLSATIRTDSVLSIVPTSLPAAVLGLLYNTTLTANGGVGPFTWSVSSGSLPAGLSLSSSGVLTGTPTIGGAVNFTLQVTDHSSPAQTATLPVSISVNALLSITSATLPDAISGVPYLGTLLTTGGVPPITWAVTAGSLPAGLTLKTSTGLITGTTTGSGTSAFTIQATDGETPAQVKTSSVSIRTDAPLSIVTNTLPDAIAGLLYNTTLSTTGGVGPVTWSVTGGTLPSGLSLNASTGVLTGTPTGTPAGVSLTLQAKDSSSPPQIQTTTLNLNLRAQLVITPVTLPPALLGLSFNASLQATGGVGPYVWSITSGSLPSGLSIDANTGVLSGIPSALLSANFTVQVTDSGDPAQTATLALSLGVTAPGVNNALFTGNYAFLFNGFDPSGNPIAMAGSIAADGAGLVTGGSIDINGAAGAKTNLAVTAGTFALNGDNRGTLSLTTSAGTQQFAVALDATGALGQFIETDVSSPTVIRGNGLLKQQSSSAFSNGSIMGGYAFGFSGATSALNRSGLVGAFTANGSGGISSGLVDANSFGTVTANKSILNTSTYSISASGRGTLTLKASGLSTVSGVVYVIDSGDMFFLRTDNFVAGTDLLSGEIVSQTGNPYALLPLVATGVLHVSGNASTTATSVGAGLVVSTGLGVLAGTFDANNNGTISSTLLAVGNYSISSPATGRGSMTFAGNTYTIYLYSPSSAFVMDASSSQVKTGQLEGQSVQPINLGSITGNYVLGTDANTNASVTLESGVFSLLNTDAFSGTTDTNATGDVVSTGNLLSGTISLSSDGRITINTGVVYVVSPNRFIQVGTTSGQTNAALVIGNK
jgi:Putative Ig domain